MAAPSLDAHGCCDMAVPPSHIAAPGRRSRAIVWPHHDMAVASSNSRRAAAWRRRPCMVTTPAHGSSTSIYMAGGHRYVRSRRRHDTTAPLHGRGAFTWRRPHSIHRCGIVTWPEAPLHSGSARCVNGCGAGTWQRRHILAGRDTVTCTVTAPSHTSGTVTWTWHRYAVDAPYDIARTNM